MNFETATALVLITIIISMTTCTVRLFENDTKFKIEKMRILEGEDNVNTSTK